jgi:pullulanase/glycogen debranching enzyme
MKKATLAMVILLLSPGIPMLSAGQDFLRSKRGIRNTYQNGNVNALDYRRLEKYQSIHNEIRKIITFRRSPRGRFTRPETFKKIEYSSDLLDGRNILSLSARHQEQKEEFLFVCNSSNENARIQIPKVWLNGKIILPEPAGLSYELKLPAWGYALITKELI